MTAPVLRSQLVTDVRTHLGWESPDSTASEVEIKRLIGQAAKRLYAKLIQARGADYYLTTASQTTTTTTNGIFFLPADFWRMQDVRIQFGGGGVAGYSMAKFARHDVAALKWGVSSGGIVNQPFRYNLRGNQKQIATGTPANLLLYTDAIEILPVPPAGLLLEYDYIPTPYQVVDSTNDVLYDGVVGFEEWIVCDVCATLVAKEEGDAGFWLSRRGEVEQLVVSCASARDEGRPQQVQDVMDYTDHFTPARRYP